MITVTYKVIMSSKLLKVLEDVSRLTVRQGLLLVIPGLVEVVPFDIRVQLTLQPRYEDVMKGKAVWNGHECRWVIILFDAHHLRIISG